MNISPDTQQNTVYALYYLVLHNYQAIAYATGLALATTFGLIKPSRGRILLMVGFALLLLSFEYSKHIQESLFEQTKQSLITERYSSRLERAISLSINKGAPFVLTVGGVSALFVGGISELISLKKSSKI